MAKVFLDTNYFIDAFHRQPERKLIASLEHHVVYISPLCFHIYCYIFKIDIPNQNLLIQKEQLQIVDFTNDILEKALQGPTEDFEDNVQLHSAADANCDIFLTNDRKLLDLKFFGKTKLAESL